MRQTKIIVIDDNEDFSVVVKLLLAKEDVEVQVALNGAVGLEMATKFLPDIVLLDIVMPGMDGIEVCKRMRQIDTLKGAYIIMLSGLKTHTDQMAAGLEAGADGYIARPISNREFLARLRSFIRLKRTEQTLEQTEKKYQGLFNSMILAYAHHRIILDETGNAIDYSFLEINPEFEKVTGFKRENIIGRSVFEVIPKTEQKWIDIYAQVALTGNEVRFVNFSGELNKYFEVYAFSPAYGEFSTLFYDVTEREVASEKLKAYNIELEKLNNDKNKFFNIIAHDLRSPFNSIIGLSELLVEQVQANDYEGIDKYAFFIKQSANRAMDLLINLLEWSRSQTGRMEFKPEHFDLIHVIQENTLLLKDLANSKSISILQEIPEYLILNADKAMINTVLRNLLSNAIKFTNKGGVVKISVQKYIKEIRVSIQDNGIGIAPERIDKLFRIEASESTPGTSNEKGTGLGLILCKEFVENHGGKIWAESNESSGTVFTFVLPDQ